MASLDSSSGSNYLLDNATDIFWTDEDIIADMVMNILNEPEKISNWKDSPVSEIVDAIGDSTRNYYSMNDPNNPYKTDNPEARVLNCIERVWKELQEE